MHEFWTEGGYNFLALDLLGPSLEDLLRYCDQQFSLQTILKITDQLV